MKFLQSFNESSKRFRLDKESTKVIFKIIDDLFLKCVSNKNTKSTLYKTINLRTMDGMPFRLPIYIDGDFEGGQAGIGFQKMNTVDPELNHVIGNLKLVINPKFVFSKKDLYNSLYHELLHAVDPTITSKYSKKYLNKYGGPETDEYYQHGIELRGITGEFFESMVMEYGERLQNCEDEEDCDLLEESIDSIVSFFNNLEIFSPLAYDILISMDGNLVGKLQPIATIFKNYPKVSTLVDHIPDQEPDCLVNLDMIRMHSPKGWKMFMTMLYTTSQEIKEMIESRKNELLE